MKQQLPYHGWCFVCGDENPRGIGLTWFIEDGVLTSQFTLNESQQGPPAHAHGGASAAILDEAMGLVIWAAGHKVAAVNIEINYHKPLPLHQPLTREARILQIDERKILSAGEIRWADKSVGVSGRGIYVSAPKLFEQMNISGEKKV